MEHKDLLRFIDEESHDLESTLEPGGSFLATAGPVELVGRKEPEPKHVDCGPCQCFSFVDNFLWEV
jgi:hypothetical protein